MCNYTTTPKVKNPATSKVALAPFRPGAAKGFEPRKITGIRKSMIVNYVTADWRATEQRAFPD